MLDTIVGDEAYCNSDSLDHGRLIRVIEMETLPI